MISFALFSLLPAAAVFGSAGTVRWAAGWHYVATVWIITTGTRLLIVRKTPELITERASSIKRRDIQGWDRVLMPVIALVAPLAGWIIAGLSFRFGWLAGFPLALRLGALAVFIGSSLLVTWSMLANPFFSAVVRIQSDRGQKVVSRGPYRLVRHPGYLGIVLVNGVTPIVLDAPWTFVPVAVVIVLTVVRTALEDRTLHAELQGYADYARSTRARLVPGVW